MSKNISLSFVTAGEFSPAYHPRRKAPITASSTNFQSLSVEQKFRRMYYLYITTEAWLRVTLSKLHTDLWLYLYLGVFVSQTADKGNKDAVYQRRFKD